MSIPKIIPLNILPSDTCNRCYKKSEQLSCCSVCKIFFYCSKRCQKKDWKEHKIDCRAIKKDLTVLDGKVQGVVSAFLNFKIMKPEGTELIENLIEILQEEEIDELVTYLRKFEFRKKAFMKNWQSICLDDLVPVLEKIKLFENPYITDFVELFSRVYDEEKPFYTFGKIFSSEKSFDLGRLVVFFYFVFENCHFLDFRTVLEHLFCYNIIVHFQDAFKSSLEVGLERIFKMRSKKCGFKIGEREGFLYSINLKQETLREVSERFLFSQNIRIFVLGECDLRRFFDFFDDTHIVNIDLLKFELSKIEEVIKKVSEKSFVGLLNRLCLNFKMKTVVDFNKRKLTVGLKKIYKNISDFKMPVFAGIKVVDKKIKKSFKKVRISGRNCSLVPISVNKILLKQYLKTLFSKCYGYFALKADVAIRDKNISVAERIIKSFIELADLVSVGTVSSYLNQMIIWLSFFDFEQYLVGRVNLSSVDKERTNYFYTVFTYAVSESARQVYLEEKPLMLQESDLKLHIFMQLSKVMDFPGSHYFRKLDEDGLIKIKCSEDYDLPSEEKCLELLKKHMSSQKVIYLYLMFNEKIECEKDYVDFVVKSLERLKIISRR